MAKKHQHKISKKKTRQKANRSWRRKARQDYKQMTGKVKSKKSKKRRKKMTNVYKQYGSKKTPQSQPIPGQEERMAENSAGGFAYTIDKWSLLDRFLILGSEGGTYYIKELKLTADNAQNVLECVQEDGERVVNRIVEISKAGRAPKNTPALFALALAQWKGNQKTREVAYQVLPEVARTGYHLLVWAAFSDNLRGTGSGWQRAVGRWFNDKPTDKLAYQAIKYQQREGWSLADLLRLAHAKPADEDHDTLYKWIVDGWDEENWGAFPETPDIVPDQVWAHERAKQATTAKEIVDLIAVHKLPRESIPTEYLNDVDVWEALLNAGMPLTALIRNLGKMTICRTAFTVQSGCRTSRERHR
jgi:60 kDa SS-A/Ro ribonucleoprotein